MADNPNLAKAKEAISAAKVRMLATDPFHVHMAFHLKLREMNDQPTLATDGTHLFYNSDFVAGLTKPEVVFGICHEVMHVVLKHFARGADLDWQTFAIAGDLAINPILKDGGKAVIANGLLPEPEFWNDSAEEHYKRLMKNKGKSNQPKQCGGGCSGVRKSENMTPAEAARQDADLNTAIMNAAEFAKKAGKLPGYIERLIQKLQAPVVSWQDVLRRYMQSIAKQDYRMLPPNRRYIHQGLYLPSLRSESVGDVLLMIDGSGSTSHVFGQFMSEFASIMLDVRPERLHVMVWDTRCTWLKTFDNFNDESEQTIAEMQSEMGAGGGTDFRECFDHFRDETGITPQVAIILTDMELYGGFPEEPEYPVMWVATTDITGPYGETVKIEVK